MPKPPEVFGFVWERGLLMIKFRMMWTSLALATTLLSAGREGSAQTKLELKFREGEVIRQEMLESVQIDVIPPGEKKIYTTKIDQRWFLESTTAKLIDETSAEIRQNFSRIAMSIQLPPPVSKMFTVDTTKPAASEEKTEQEMRFGISKIIGLEWSVTLKPDGSVADVALTDELTDALVENPQAAMLKDTFSDAGLRKLTDQSTITFPSKPVKKGDTWEQILTRPFPQGKLTIKRLCTALGPVEDGLEKISVKSQTTYQAAKDAKQTLVLTENSGDGEVFFDPRVSRIVRSKLTQVLVFKEGMPEKQGTQRIKTVNTLLPADRDQPEK